jgi:hypothetical protein
LDAHDDVVPLEIVTEVAPVVTGPLSVFVHTEGAPTVK